MYKLLLAGLLISTSITPVYAEEQFSWIDSLEKRDNAISEHNARIREDNERFDNSEKLTEEVREINQFNLYTNSKDYDGETIVIEKPNYD